MRSNELIYKNEYVCSTEGKWELSSDKNMLILVLDTMDSRVFERCLKEGISEEELSYFESELDGFTYYPDTLGAFSLTDYAIPQIITGELYEEKEEYGDYIERAYEASPLLSRLNNEGWDIGIHACSRMPQKLGNEIIGNLKKVCIL